MKLQDFLKISKTPQGAIGKRVGVGQSAVSYYCQGKLTPSASVIAKIHQATGGLVTYGDWFPTPNTDTTARDINTIKLIVKERSIKMKHIADYLKLSCSRLSQKFHEEAFKPKELANIIYYINNCNPVTGELIKQSVPENRGYFKAFRHHEIIKQYKLSLNEIGLLYIIATRANKAGKALIGDHKNLGITEYDYKSAKAKLSQLEWCQFLGVPGRGTVAQLMKNPLFET